MPTSTDRAFAVALSDRSPRNLSTTGQIDRAAEDGATAADGSQLEEDVSRWWLALPTVVVLLALPSALAGARRRRAWHSPNAHVA